MYTNGEVMSLLSDEGGIFDIISGLYSDGRSNIDLLLQAHSGSSVRIDRGSRPPIFMEKAILTMGLTVQPQVMKKISANKTFRGRGLLGRFLYVVPKSNIGFRTLDTAPISKEKTEDFQKTIRSILNHSQPDNNTGAKHHILNLSEDAYKKWLEYAQCNEKLMGEEIGLLSHITDWAGKLPGAIARISGLLHVIRYAQDCPWEYEISIHDMSAAIRIGHCLSFHALAVFDLLEEETGLQQARTIFQWIKAEELKEFSRRRCKRKFRRFKEEEITIGLNYLENIEIVRSWVKIPTQGRHSEMYTVNPKIANENKN